MVDDPYKILGISRDATKDEIKKAYRAKAKEYHPDLHPDDPLAAEKMNEINEAYDMLNNPEKYQNRTQGSQNTGGYRQSSDPWQDFGDWQDFGGFGSFEEFFGFGGSGTNPEPPKSQPGDSSDIRQAIDFINMKQYQYADNTLNSILSTYRNARWFYLSALANYGLGRQMLALEQIQKAVQMEPSSQLYRNTLNTLKRASTEYRQNGEEFQNYAESMGRVCQGLCLAQLFCMFCRC